MEFAGILSISNAKEHVAHRLALPRGASRLDVRLEHSRGPGLGHMICLSAFDARGFRGSGHRMGTARGGDAVHEVRIAADDATPGYLPGAVPAGELTIWLHAHRIVPGAPCRYQLIVEWEEGELPAAPPAAPVRRAPVLRGPGWYRGDLHAHTRHSDGAWDVSDLLREADVEMVQDLVLVAINQALRDSRMLAAQRLGPMAGGALGVGPGGEGEGGAE